MLAKAVGCDGAPELLRERGGLFVALCLSGGHRLAAAIWVSVMAKPRDSPGKLPHPSQRRSCPGEREPTWSPPSLRGETCGGGEEARGKFSSGKIRRTKRSPGGLQGNSARGSARWESPSPHTHAHTSGETSDKSNSFVMLCWMRADCIQ